MSKETPSEPQSTPRSEHQPLAACRFEGTAQALEATAQSLQELVDNPERYGRPYLQGELLAAADRMRVATRSLRIATEPPAVDETEHQPIQAVPEVPARGGESIPTRLHIPRTNWEHPTVREFVDLLHQAEDLQRDLSIASSHHLNRFSAFGEPLGTLRASGRPEKLAQLRDLFGAPDMALTLAGRYEAAELLFRGATQIMQEGFGEPQADARGYLRDKLNAAINRLGLRVVQDPGGADKAHG